MLIVKLWHYFNGYVIIKIEGFAIEKFLNLVVEEKIFIYDISRKTKTCMFLKIAKRDFPRLKNIIRKVSCRAEIIDKKGFPFLISKLKKRKFLAIGATMAIIIIYILSSFIWKIEIQGNDRLSTDTIIKQLEDFGLEKGELKRNFDTEELENKLLFMNKDELTYVKIRFAGTKVQVDIVEKEELPPSYNRESPSNVVANRDGIIHQIFVYGGEKMVKEGDLVKEGDILIKGEVQIIEEEQNQEELNEEEKKENPTVKVHAWGDVYAKTWYEENIDIPTKNQEEKNEDEKVIRRAIIIGNKEITPRKLEIPYENFDKKVTQSPLVQLTGINIPIYIKNTEYYPQDSMIELTDAQIKENALSEVKKRIENQREQTIEVSKSEIEIIRKDHNHANVNVFLETVEKIGSVQEIDS